MGSSVSVAQSAGRPQELNLINGKGGTYLFRMSTETSKDNKEIIPRSRSWMKPIDQMDVWLDSEGFYRKHTAKDGSCLFRAVSEQLFLTQVVHQDVRKLVTEYLLRHSDYFQKFVTCPLIEYVEKMRSPLEWGGKVEIEAMARMFKHDFKLYEEIGKPPEIVTNHGHSKLITLCFTQDKHYDSVYTKEYITVAAVCQSIVYEILYKKVFELKEVDYAVRKMLHDKTARYQREHVPFLSSGFALRLEMRDCCLNVKDLLDFGITPFPYKVAKSLDPDVYRNVEYDTWNDYRKGLRYGFYAWNCRELQVGVKCLVKLEDNIYHGHIQEMQPNKGPVKVFIEELGEKLIVPYDTLELLPPSPQPSVSIRNTYAFKLAQLQLSELKPEEIWQKGKKFLKSIASLRQKSNQSDYRRNDGHFKESSKDLDDNEDAPVVSSSDFYDEEIDYHAGEENNYPHNYVPHNMNETEEQVSADSAKSGVPLIVPVMESYPYPSYPAPAGHPVPPMSLPLADINTAGYPCTPIPVNLMAPKSLNIDGSDLPHSDVSTLRFFYNLGLDVSTDFMHYGTSYYVTSNGAYVPVENFPAQHLDNNMASQPAPQGVKKNNVYEGPPLIQQNEVSSTNNLGVSVPMSQAYYQPTAVECEPYCMTVPSYVDYGICDYSPVYTPTHPFPPPSSYVTPDGVIYQQILPPGMVPTTPPM